MIKQINQYTKNFSLWCDKKSIINQRDGVEFNEREIWWRAVGVNIGYEINGKGNSFVRPVLVLKKTSRKQFIGLPITSTQKELPGYFGLGKDSVVFEQVRTFNSRRLIDRKETISEKKFGGIVKSFLKYTNPL